MARVSASKKKVLAKPKSASSATAQPVSPALEGVEAVEPVVADAAVPEVVKPVEAAPVPVSEPVSAPAEAAGPAAEAVPAAEVAPEAAAPAPRGKGRRGVELEQRRAERKAARQAALADKVVARVAKAGRSAEVIQRGKQKLVRDSFTMPVEDFHLLQTLKQRALGFEMAVKKSELLRAGLRALNAMEPAALQALLGTVPKLKAGRPAKGKEGADAE